MRERGSGGNEKRNDAVPTYREGWKNETADRWEQKKNSAQQKREKKGMSKRETWKKREVR